MTLTSDNLLSVNPDGFWSRVDMSGDCWLWLGTGSPYGKCYVPSAHSSTGAHRVAFVLVGGLLREGQQIDHLCRVKRCVRPAHLEAVSPAENSQRVRAGFCDRGHVLSPGRGCRTCKTERQRERRTMRAIFAPPAPLGTFNLRKTHCPQGHLYSDENTYIQPSRKSRSCKECMRIRTRARKVSTYAS